MTDGLKIIDFSCRSARHVHLTVTPGRTVGMTGPSGSGKSIFLRAVADLEPYDGQMLLDGADASGMPAHLWRRKVGLLPAESAWWFDTVGEHFNQLIPPGLEALGFTEKAMTWQISHLSSGERQRLSLLRLLANEPRVLLLDEPTANLDPANTRRVEDFIAHYCKVQQACTLWISHDAAQLDRCCDETLVLEQQAFHLK